MKVSELLYQLKQIEKSNPSFGDLDIVIRGQTSSPYFDNFERFDPTISICVASEVVNFIGGKSITVVNFVVDDRPLKKGEFYCVGLNIV